MKAERLDMLRFARQAVISVWIFVLGLIAVFAPPSGLANGVLLLIVLGLVVPVMALSLWKGAAHHTIAEPGLQPLDVAMIGGGLRRLRGPRRRDEGRR
jgi:uncharacterized protein YhhL (DUF1145 family)